MTIKRIAIVAVNEDGYRIGQSHHNARISDYAVQCIRDAREERGLSYGKLASMFKKVTQYLCDQAAEGQAKAHRNHEQPQST